MSAATGGPAFAHGDPTNGGDPGMDLRDWFAGQAMTAFIEPYVNKGVDLPSPSLCARWAYTYADAMLIERMKRTQGPS